MKKRESMWNECPKWPEERKARLTKDTEQKVLKKETKWKTQNNKAVARKMSSH